MKYGTHGVYMNFERIAYFKAEYITHVLERIKMCGHHPRDFPL